MGGVGPSARDPGDTEGGPGGGRPRQSLMDPSPEGTRTPRGPPWVCREQVPGKGPAWTRGQRGQPPGLSNPACQDPLPVEGTKTPGQRGLERGQDMTREMKQREVETGAS